MAGAIIRMPRRGGLKTESFDDEAAPKREKGRPAFRRGRGNVSAATGLAIFAASLFVSTIRLWNVENTIERNQAIIVDQAITIQIQRNQIAANRQRLRGVTPAGMGSNAYSNDDIGGHNAIERGTHGQRVIVYARGQRADTRQRELVNSLRMLGFRVQVSQPRNPTRAANAVWFGREVSPVAVEIAAHALLRAGYKLQHIGPFEDPAGPKAQLIEIGVSTQALNRAAITQQTLQRALREAGLQTSE